MQGVQPIRMNKNKAERLWKEHLELLKITKAQHLEDLKTLYYHLSKGKPVIDIFEAFKFAGKNDKDQPLLAICRADLKQVRFEKLRGGAGRFFAPNTWRSDHFNTPLPQGTFQKFSLDERGFIKNSMLQTNVPIIPAKCMPQRKTDLKNFFILWEANDWDEIPHDPFLLKQITPNLFVVEAQWDLTRLERAVIRGRST